MMDKRIVREMMKFEEIGQPIKNGTLEVFSPEGKQSYQIMDGRVVLQQYAPSRVWSYSWLDGLK